MPEAKHREAEFFELVAGRHPAKDDLDDIRDLVTRQRLLQRIQKAQLGNYGHHRRLDADFLELIADFGPGFRIYLGEDGERLIIILVVGDKSTQASDIREARCYWEAYKTRKKKGGHHGPSKAR
jgi:putative addiction module killer protein